MKKRLVIGVLVLCSMMILVRGSVFAIHSSNVKNKDIFCKTVKDDFRDIKVIDKRLTLVSLKGTEVNIVGLEEQKLTDYLRFRIRKNFANIKIEEPDFDEYTGKQVGLINLEVWVLGNCNPSVFLIKCEFWNHYFKGNYRLWEREMLGFGSLDLVNDSIKECIDDLIQTLASIVS